MTFVNLSQILGFIGTGLVVVAYVPQIHHLLKEHCSAGISIRAYALWFSASLLFLVHAIMIRDVVFISVQVGNVIAICIIWFLARRYEKDMCRVHLETHLQQLKQGGTQRS